MQKTVIRPAGEGDISAIIALYRELDAAMVDLQPEFFCEAPREEAEISSTVKAQDADFLLAEQDGTPVGFALVTYAGWTPAYSCVLPHRYAAGRSGRRQGLPRPGHRRRTAGRRQALGPEPAAGIRRAAGAGPERGRAAPV